MTVGVATCSPEASIQDIARLFIERYLEIIVVIDPVDGHAIGVISQNELIKAYALPGNRPKKAEEIMQDQVPQVPADIPLTAAAQIMIDRGVRALFLMHHSNGIEYPAAVITYQHILRHLAASDPNELKDLGGQAIRQTPVEAFTKRRNEARQKNSRKQG